MVRNVLAWAAVGALSSAAWADLLLPGDTQYKDHPAVAQSPDYDTVPPPFAGGPNQVGFLDSPIALGFEGNVASEVFRDPASGNLTFEYTISLTDMNTAAIVRATMNGWDNVGIVNVGAPADGSSGTFDTPEWTDGDPLFIARTPVTGAGLEVQYRAALGDDLVGTVIGPGDLSSTLFVETDVQQFTTGNIALIDTAVVGTANVLIPIPEPSTLLALLAGVGFCAARHRRR